MKLIRFKTEEKMQFIEDYLSVFPDANSERLGSLFELMKQDYCEYIIFDYESREMMFSMYRNQYGDIYYLPSAGVNRLIPDVNKFLEENKAPKIKKQKPSKNNIDEILMKLSTGIDISELSDTEKEIFDKYTNEN